MKTTTRALIIAPQWIGDAVMTEPLLRRLYANAHHITVGALPWVAPIYRAMPHVSAVLEFPFAHGGLQLGARWRLAQQIQRQFDVAYVCPNSFKSALLPLFAGVPQRIGYLGESRFGLLTRRLKNPAKGQRPPMVAFYSALGGAADTLQDSPRLTVPAAQVAQTLQALGLTAQRYHVLAPGAEYGPAKRWPNHHFAELALQLNLPVVLLGSDKEQAQCADIEATVQTQQPGKVVNLAGQTTLDQALCVIAACSSMVSNDSGLMHVAAGLGVPQVAIFGSSSPLHTPPLNPRASVLWLKNNPHYQPPLDCAPCFKRQCPLGHTRCLNDIQAADVLCKI